MNKLISNKPRLMLIVLGVIVIMSIIFIIISDFSPKPSTSATPAVVLKISPDQNTGLTVGLNQPFTVTFSDPVILDDLTVTFKALNLTGSATTSTPETTTQELDKSRTKLIITPKDPIKPHRGYDLTISSRQNTRPVLNLTYVTTDPTPTPFPKNNLTLVPSMPHETDNYILSYLKERNVYIFNFKFDTKSKIDADTQFQKAKADAIKFIESKGIDIKSIIIEWRYS